MLCRLTLLLYSGWLYMWLRETSIAIFTLFLCGQNTNLCSFFTCWSQSFYPVLFQDQAFRFQGVHGVRPSCYVPFPSSSGGLGGTFYTGCSPISCRNKLKTCLTKIRETPLQKQMLRFCANRTFYLQPFLPIAKPYLIFCFISLHGGKFSSE